MSCSIGDERFFQPDLKARARGREGMEDANGQTPAINAAAAAAAAAPAKAQLVLFFLLLPLRSRERERETRKRREETRGWSTKELRPSID